MSRLICEAGSSSATQKVILLKKGRDGQIGLECSGANIKNVIPGGPADVAGIQSGMRLVAINYQRLKVTDDSDVVQKVFLAAPEEFPVTISVCEQKADTQLKRNLKPDANISPTRSSRRKASISSSIGMLLGHDKERDRSPSPAAVPSFAQKFCATQEAATRLLLTALYLKHSPQDVKKIDSLICQHINKGTHTELQLVKMMCERYAVFSADVQDWCRGAAGSSGVSQLVVQHFFRHLHDRQQQQTQRHSPSLQDSALSDALSKLASLERRNSSYTTRVENRETILTDLCKKHDIKPALWTGCVPVGMFSLILPSACSTPGITAALCILCYALWDTTSERVLSPLEAVLSYGSQGELLELTAKAKKRRRFRSSASSHSSTPPGGSTPSSEWSGSPKKADLPCSRGISLTASHGERRLSGMSAATDGTSSALMETVPLEDQEGGEIEVGEAEQSIPGINLVQPSLSDFRTVTGGGSLLERRTASRASRGNTESSSHDEMMEEYVRNIEKLDSMNQEDRMLGGIEEVETPPDSPSGGHMGDTTLLGLEEEEKLSKTVERLEEAKKNRSRCFSVGSDDIRAMGGTTKTSSTSELFFDSGMNTTRGALLASTSKTQYESNRSRSPRGHETHSSPPYNDVIAPLPRRRSVAPSGGNEDSSSTCSNHSLLIASSNSQHLELNLTPSSPQDLELPCTSGGSGSCHITDESTGTCSVNQPKLRERAESSEMSELRLDVLPSGLNVAVVGPSANLGTPIEDSQNDKKLRTLSPQCSPAGRLKDSLKKLSFGFRSTTPPSTPDQRPKEADIIRTLKDALRHAEGHNDALLAENGALKEKLCEAEVKVKQYEIINSLNEQNEGTPSRHSSVSNGSNHNAPTALAFERLEEELRHTTAELTTAHRALRKEKDKRKSQKEVFSVELEALRLELDEANLEIHESKLKSRHLRTEIKDIRRGSVAARALSVEREEEDQSMEAENAMLKVSNDKVVEELIELKTKHAWAVSILDRLGISPHFKSLASLKSFPPVWPLF